MLKVYPAIFMQDENGYTVSFPDLEGCFTEGKTIEHAVEMAQEALGLYIVSLEERSVRLPVPTPNVNVKCDANEFITLISTDIDKYRRKNKTVKKTLSIPQWLNEEAKAKHINFSFVLQKALKEELLTVN